MGEGRTIDILPTLLELAAIERSAGDTLEGESLLAIGAEESADRDTYAEGMLYGPSERSLVSHGFKLLFDAADGHWALYDIQVDPSERSDVSKNRPEQTEEMRAALEAHYERLQAVTRRRVPARPRETAPPITSNASGTTSETYPVPRAMRNQTMSIAARSRGPLANTRSSPPQAPTDG